MGNVLLLFWFLKDEIRSAKFLFYFVLIDITRSSYL
jgi:hypothetical protein